MVDRPNVEGNGHDSVGPSADDVNSILTLQKFGDGVRRNIPTIVTSSIIIGAMSLLMAFMLIPLYESTATIRIDEKQVGIKPIEGLDLESSYENEINTEMEMLRSRLVTEHTVDSLDLQMTAQTPFAFSPRFPFLVPPRRVPIRGVVSSMDVPRNALTASYRLTRQPNGEFRVTGTSSDSTIAMITPGVQSRLG